MSNTSLVKLEEKLNKKKEQVKKLNQEISSLDARIKAQRQADLIRAVNDNKLNTEQCQILAQGLNDGSILEFLRNKGKEDEDEENN